MKNQMIRIAGLLLLSMLLMLQTVSAEKYDYVEKSYNFKNIQNIFVYDMDFSQVNMGSNVLEMNYNAIFHEKEQKAKLNSLKADRVMTKMALDLNIPVNQLDEVFDDYIQNYADIYVTAEVTRYDKRSEYHPEYTTWETRQERSWVKDNHGNRVEVVEERQYPVVHPAYYTDYIDLTVRMTAFDAKTDTAIFVREDVRSRDTDDARGMHGRICSDFFEDLGKLTRK